MHIGDSYRDFPLRPACCRYPLVSRSRHVWHALKARHASSHILHSHTYKMARRRHASTCSTLSTIRTRMGTRQCTLLPVKACRGDERARTERDVLSIFRPMYSELEVRLQVYISCQTGRAPSWSSSLQRSWDKLGNVDLETNLAMRVRPSLLRLY